MEDIQPLVLSALSPKPPPPQAYPITPAHMAPSGDSAAAASPVAHKTLVRLHALFSQQQDVKLRHLAFMLLSRLGGLPPTLYRPLEEPEAVGAQGITPLIPPPPFPSHTSGVETMWTMTQTLLNELARVSCFTTTGLSCDFNCCPLTPPLPPLFNAGILITPTSRHKVSSLL